MAKTLVTGGAGFIGSHLCERLLAKGDEVIVLDNFSSGSRANLANLGDKLHIIEDSLLNVKAHETALSGVTRVYHLAALISGYDSLHDPEAYVDVNTVGLLRLIEVLRGLKDVRLIFASSSTVYGNNPNPPCSETDSPSPLTMYALSKYNGEHTLSIYQSLYEFDYVCLRLFNVYGPRQSPNHPYANVTCKFSHAAANGQSVLLYGDGEQSRDFVYVDDVVDALLLVSDNSQHQLYNVGTGQDASINDLLREAGRAGGKPLEVERRGDWPNDIRAIRADISRIQEEFDFCPKVQLADGIDHTVQFFRNQAGA